MLIPVVRNAIKGWISSGVVQGVILSTPCGSQAHKAGAGGASLRTLQFPRGVRGLQGHDLAYVRLGNCLADFAFEISNLCYEGGVIGLEENPFSSYLWHYDNRVQQLNQHNVQDIKVDMCQCGAAYRKRTRLRLWHWKSPFMQGLVCAAEKGVCGRTGRKHVILSRCNDRRFAESAVHEHHGGFARILAKEFSKAIRRQQVTIIWKDIRPNG